MDNAIEFLTHPPLEYREFKTTNWTKFTNQVNSALAEISPPTDRNLTRPEIDLVINQITNEINNVTDKVFPKQTVQYRNYAKLGNRELILISTRRKLKKKLMTENKKFFPEPAYCKWLTENIKSLSVLIDKQISENLASKFNERVKAIKTDSNMFREINNLTGRNRFCEISEIRTEDKTLTTDMDIATTFAGYYGDVFKASVPKEIPPEVFEYKLRNRDISNTTKHD